MDAKQLQEAAIGIAVRHCFCNVIGIEQLVYEAISEDEIDYRSLLNEDGYTVTTWDMFETLDVNELFEIVENLKDSIYHATCELL
jgi:hypothetical protein